LSAPLPRSSGGSDAFDEELCAIAACTNLGGNPNVPGHTGTKSDPTGHCTVDASGVRADPLRPTTFCSVE
jgi:hypothetical protein